MNPNGNDKEKVQNQITSLEEEILKDHQTGEKIDN